MGIFLIIFALVISILIFFVFWRIIPSTKTKEGKWGINVKPTSCPNCNESLPLTRLPMNIQHLLWGGWTCPQCDTNIDKWGNEINKK